MPQPKFTDKGNSYDFAWDEYRLSASVSKITETRDGTVKGEILFTTSDPEYHNTLHRQIYNFSSPIAQRTLKTEMARRYPCKVDWDSVLGQLSMITLDKMREGEQVQELWTDNEIPPPQYKLYPILPEGEPTMIFANGGSGKTYVGQFIATCIQLPWSENPLGFKPKYGHVLVLDYEAGGNTALFRLKRIKVGHNLPEFMIAHRKCLVPLDKDIDNIRAYIRENEIDTVIIDSAFGACSGDMNDNAVAKSFFQAVRLLPTTTLILHHVAKGLKKSDGKTAYGSAFFNNAVRMSWELVSQNEPGEPTLRLALLNRKSNNSMLHIPIGIEVEFDDPGGPVVFSRFDVAGAPEFSHTLSLKDRIKKALNCGAMTTKDLCIEVEAKYPQVTARCNELKADNKLVRLPDGRWGLTIL
jgi:hypothetical protein